MKNHQQGVSKLTKYETALKLVLSYCVRTRTKTISIIDAAGYLAEDVTAKSDLPRFTMSAVDGYGVKVADLKGANERNHVRLKYIGEVKAGDFSKIKIKIGECIRILTGAPIPLGVEAVVMQEFTKKIGEKVFFCKTASLGDNFRYKGEEFKKGEIILPKFTYINAAVVGILASYGIEKVLVYQKPKVAVLVTGNELVEIGKKLKPGQIYDSNFYTLFTALKQLEIDAINLGIAKDNKSELSRKIKLGIKSADILLVSGGISVGDYDYVQEIFNTLKIKKIFWRVAVKPGKPTYFGIKGKKLIFGLPGNPVAALLMFDRLVKPAILKMMGMYDYTPIILNAKLKNELKKKTKRLEFVRGILKSNENGELSVVATKGQESHMLSGMVNANCLIYFPTNSNVLKKGSMVKVEMI